MARWPKIGKGGRSQRNEAVLASNIKTSKQPAAFRSSAPK